MSIKKFIRITLALVSALALLSLNLTCSNLVAPEEEQPGRRDYVWTIDTLEYPGSFQTSMEDIWGSSPNNVYVVGHNDRAYGKMYRYDGNKWNAIDIGEYLGFRNVDLASIFGFSFNDIWVVGAELYGMVVPPYTVTRESLIIKIDGSNWIKMNIEKRDILLTINGSSPNNIFAGGIYGSFYQYNGITWKRINFDTTLSVKSIVTFSPEKTYVMSYVQKQPERVYFDFYDGNIFVRLDSSTTRYDPKFGDARIGTPDNKTLYSVGNGIYKFENNKWKLELNTPDVIRRIRGNHSKNIFAVGVNLIYHFNGTDWYQFPSFIKDQDIWWSGVWTDGKEVFICGFPPGSRKTYILHGK
jgi:hypothetical protein